MALAARRGALARGGPCTTKNYNPFGNAFPLDIVAAIPIVVLLYFIALHPHRDATGRRTRREGAVRRVLPASSPRSPSRASAFGMPVASAGSACALGSLSGFLGIIWIVLAGDAPVHDDGRHREVRDRKESIVHISFDRRLQVLLIAFSFGAIIEGTSGSGRRSPSPARDGGLGFPAFPVAVLNLLANTAPSRTGDRAAHRHPRGGERARSATLSTIGRPALPWVSLLVRSGRSSSS